MSYQFRPMAAVDLPMVRRWLNLLLKDRLVDTPDGPALLMVRNA